MALNCVTMVGRLARDPEMRTTNDGTPVMNCAIAVDRDVKSQNGERLTDFFNIAAWRNTANFIGQYFHKGDLIGITGRLQLDNYVDREGNNRSTPQIVVSTANFVAPKERRDNDGQDNGQGYRQQNRQQNGYNNQARQQAYPNSAPMPDPDEEGLPF